jgi:hypothetical protein
MHVSSTTAGMLWLQEGEPESRARPTTAKAIHQPWPQFPGLRYPF